MTTLGRDGVCSDRNRLSRKKGKVSSSKERGNVPMSRGGQDSLRGGIRKQLPIGTGGKKKRNG